MESRHLVAIDKHGDLIKRTMAEISQIILELRSLRNKRDVLLFFKYESKNDELIRLPKTAVRGYFIELYIPWNQQRADFSTLCFSARARNKLHSYWRATNSHQYMHKIFWLEVRVLCKEQWFLYFWQKPNYDTV